MAAFTKEKTLEGLLIQRGVTRITLVPSSRIARGFATRTAGNLVFIHPEVFALFVKSETEEELMTLMKELRIR